MPPYTLFMICWYHILVDQRRNPLGSAHSNKVLELCITQSLPCISLFSCYFQPIIYLICLSFINFLLWSSGNLFPLWFLLFLGLISSWISYQQCTQPSELEDTDRHQNKPPIIQEETVSNLLLHPDCHKSMGPDGIQLRVLRELTKIISIFYQQSWSTLEDPGGCRLASVTPIYKKGQKEDLQNCRPVSQTSISGKAMEKIVLSVIVWHVQVRQGIRPNQHGSMKGKSCLTNQISFYKQMTRLVDEGKAVNIIYLDFNKTFDTVSCSILLEKLAAHDSDRCTLCWVKNWLEDCAQRVVMNKHS